MFISTKEPGHSASIHIINIRWGVTCIYKGYTHHYVTLVPLYKLQLRQFQVTNLAENFSEGCRPHGNFANFGAEILLTYKDLQGKL